MEGVLCKISSADIQKENLNLGVDREVYVDSKTRLSSNDITNNKTSETQEETKGVNGHIENGSQTPINGGSPSATDTAIQKTYSPTLIGSAIQAMKNLFSPDKTKAKSVSVLSPINQQRSPSGSPRSSIFIPGTADIFSSESGMEILTNIHSVSGENNLKNHLQITDIGGIPSPLNFESHNNTDDSFLTTVSLIDESFHSAVTHLEEHGEAFKNGTIFMENILNNSQNLDLVDPYNDTLESDSYLLETTTLKIGSFTSHGSKMCNVSILDADGNVENLNSGNGKVQNAETEENVQNSSIQLGGSKEGSPKNERQSSNALHETQNEHLEMGHLFLSKSFEKPASSQQNKSEAEGNNKMFEKENDTLLELPNDVRVEKSISTTTVVLNSVDLDMLSVLKADDFEAYIPAFGCSSEEDELSGKPLNELHGVLPRNQSSDRSSSPSTSFSSCQEKKCMSEGNSPNHGLNPNKVKLNKSDELISLRSESLEGKRTFQGKNSSVDISLMKHSEASEMTKECFAKVTTEHQSEIDEKELSTEKPNPVAVFSQQSYTILTHDNSLNRPVIEAVSVTNDLPWKETFPTIQSDENLNKSWSKNCKNASFSAEDLVKPSELKQSTPIWDGNNESGQKFFRPTVLTLHSPDSKKFICGDVEETVSKRPDPMEISPVDPVDQVFTAENDMSGSYCSAGFDPDSTKVVQGKDPEELKISGESSETLTIHKMNQTFDKKQQSPKNASDKPNQTFLKKFPSPKLPKQTEGMGHKLNQTFDKNSSKSKNLNSTFTKKRDSGEMEKANHTFDISGPSDVATANMNKTYDKPQFNETFDKKTDSSLMSKTQILESPTRNQTFVKPIDSDFQGQNLNKTFDKGHPAGEIASGQECGTTDTNNKPKIEKTQPAHNNDGNESFSSGKSSNTSVLGSDLSTVVLNEELNRNQSVDDLSEKLEKMVLEGDQDAAFDVANAPVTEGISADLQMEEKLLNSLKEGKMGCDPDLVQLIQEQFSPNDIEKICNVVQDFSSVKLSNDIMKASEQFDKSFHGSFPDAEFKPPETVLKSEKPVTVLSPNSFDFLNSIRGKPTGRDLSRESLYVKFDPLVQPTSNSLIDFTKEGEALATTDSVSPQSPHSTSICEQLLAISPEKKPDEIVPPLTPLSHKAKSGPKEDNTERLKELQNEIYFLKNLYAERERTNKAKMDEWECQLAKLTSENCFLEDKLKESNEREKSLVKKIKEQNDSIGKLKIIMEEYVKVISKLTGELETLRTESEKQVESLSLEKDSYMTHLQNTEAAFTDVHTKYEKSKTTIVSLKANVAMYKSKLEEQGKKLEELKSSEKETREKALIEFQKIQEEINETKANHAQEVARLRAQLRKTELKVEALQESLDQKIKENQKLTAICDELIEGKK